ncbi:MAG: hypothetical protein IT307_20565 [Chloroflexi bacterium]|nr:hypothetical protein [Chloroflexota bacterium]
MTAANIGPDGQPEARNMRLVGHFDMDWRGDGMHVNVTDGYAFFAHMGDNRIGTSIVDVRDPEHPTLVAQIPVPDHTHSHKVQIVGDVLLVNYEQYGSGGTGQTGVKTFDISDPREPREIGFYAMPGRGVHRPTYWENPYAYVSGSDAPNWDDQFLITLDVSDPTNMKEVGRWWYPGQHLAGGESPSWKDQGLRYALHHAIARGNRLYLGYWDAGLVILDNSDRSKPTFLSNLKFTPEESGETHSAVPMPGRDVLVLTDECIVNDCQDIMKQVRVVDISDDRNPKVVSLLPVPQGNFCERGGRFGPHNIHEGRPGTLQDGNTVYLTYFNAGIRVYDISDAANPREIAYFIPEAPQGRRSIQLNDLVVTNDGLIYVSDRFAGGLYIFELTGRD